ncbi:adult-specific rigid cuticular protein 15.7 [Trichonephila inaurata madagascariensis]|uniref:Adult-specific rigid cuticular protein 15.7 n=1 Tax=Trichonephila inaurata madagascariensis TaxID=2747483 RepID=A0A8X7C9J8_9ARAC|nr:adult-specific rigid cuticular protein 15.7 [Trichonephila inaurata madagascariensis]
MIAKVAFFCAALAAVSASGLIAPLVNTGVSARSQTQDVIGNYAFGYNIKDGLGATNSRSEVGDGYGNKKGSYTITDIDGRADDSPPSSPPPYAGPFAPVVNHVAPLPPLRCPVAYGAPVAAVAAPVAYGGVIGHGASLGLGYGAGIVGAGYGKVLH